MTGTPFIRTIQFNDRHPIELPTEGVLALVGANNVGKTYFLKLLRSYIHGTAVEEVSPNGDIFDNIELGWRGSPEEAAPVAKERVENAFTPTEHGFRCNNRLSYAGGSIVKESQFNTLQSQTNSLGVFSDLFVEFDDAIARVHETSLKRQVAPQNNTEKTSLTQSAFENERASERIKNYFQRIFHKEISYYERHGNIGFILTPELQSASSAGHALNQDTKNHMDNSPKLWHQGLGMRSVLGLLLKIFAADKEIIIVDEPEAFLHPPQAAGLGNVLSEIAVSEKKQIILATHDRNLLNGLLKSGDHRVSIQRISRSGDSSWVKSIEPATLSNVRVKSLIRYSTIFDSLFVRMTVLVENEKDAYFYSEAIEHILTKDSNKYP